MLTELQITNAIKAIPGKVNPEKGRATMELSDGGERGSGRLSLLIRAREKQDSEQVKKTTITSEWYAVWHRDGHRVKSKIGTYPDVSLKAARAVFRDSFRPEIAIGKTPVG
ncbi:MAG TPA: hypothetical protein DEQ40_08400, partial [Oxalobacteraceae bacterium]|nr:hypothetical protein [Oxalobacteraceae bacterium]